MKGRLQRLRNVSLDVPIGREKVRAIEVVLSVFILAVPFWLYIDAGGYESFLIELGYVLGVGAPPFLAVVVLVGGLDDGLTIGTVVLGLLALVTLYITFVSVYVLINPPEGGGVYGGHLFTFAAGLVLAVSVIGRTLVVLARNRLLSD